MAGWALAGLASAQSSLLLYGRLDLGMQSSKTPQGRLWRQRSGMQSSSQWGLRGIEDLGGGLKVTFILENGFAANTGANLAGLQFGRRTTLGLLGRLGSLQFGRRVTPVADVLYAVEPAGRGAGLGFNDILASSPRGYARRANNQVRWETPKWRGLGGQLMYALGESSTAPDGPRHANDVMGMNITYAAGPWYMGYAHQRAFDVAGLGVAPSPLAGTIIATTPNTFRTLAGSYDAQTAKFYAFVAANRRAEIRLTPTEPVQPAIDQRIYSAGVSVPLGDGLASLQFGKVDDNVPRATGSADAKLWTAAFLHPLSKRTNLYASFTHVRNDHYTVGFGGFTAMSNGLYDTLNSSTPTTGVTARSSALSLGLRHLF